MAASGSDEAPDAGQPGTGPGELVPDAEHAAGLPPATAHGAQPAGHADAAPYAAPAHHSNTDAPENAASEETPPQGPPGAHAKSENRAATADMPKRAADREKLPGGHNRGKHSFDAFMASCRSDPHTNPAQAAPRGHPEARGDHIEGTPLTLSRQAHLQRNYTALGTKTEHAAATDDRPATARGAADQAPGQHSAQGSGTRVEAGTNTASEPTGQPPGTTSFGGRGHLDYALSEGDARHPSAHAEQAAAQDLGLWTDWLTTGERLALAVSIRWLLTLRCRHPEERTRTMADITLGRRAEHTPPTTMDHLRQWHYVADRLMAHMGAYSPDEMNGLHWQWHQRAALRIRTAMQRHNIWAIPASPGHQGHASGHERPRSQEVRGPPRQAARRNSPGRHQGPPSGMGSPSGMYRSPLQPFAPRRDQGSPHNQGVQGGTPERHQETRNPGRSRRRCRTPPPAARRVVFHEGMGRGHGGLNDPNAQGTSSASNPQRRSKRPRTERAHIPTIHTAAKRVRQAARHTDPHQAADGGSILSAASLPGSAAGPLPGAQQVMDPRPRGPVADQRPEQGVGGQTSRHAPHRERGVMTPVPDTGTGRPTNWARTPPQLQYSQTAGARRMHRDNRNWTRAAQERTKK